MSRALALLLLAVTAAAEPEREFLREEAYNYRVIGRLPAGWKRTGTRLAYTYSIDAIPHAHIHFVRQRVNGALDVRKEIERRASSYRFPGAPKTAKGKIGKVQWAGRDALGYEFKATVQGVECTRRATVLFVNSIWYELIETVYGAGAESDERCRAGLDVFRSGFRLLTSPLPEGVELDTAERTIKDEQFGFEIVKPKGFIRMPVNTGADPGCRVAFEREAQNGRLHARVRLFEYAVRRKIAPDKWFDVFFTSFGARHSDPKREEVRSPRIAGSKSIWSEQFTGMRDKQEVRTRVHLVWSESGRVFVLRVRVQAEADKAFEQGLKRVTESFKVR